MDDKEPRAGERIAKLLARAGIASRREVERMIAEGRVKLGGEPVTTPATVLTDLRGVTVDDRPVKAAEPPRLFAFHKPAGLITAERDPAGRPTIYTALRNALPPGAPRLMPVGRLDLNTEGLLLLTNDGELKRAMELPSSGIPRTYRARTFGDISQAQLEELIHGLTVDGVHYGRIDANMERRTGRNQWIEMTITEGKNREVRRVLEHLGLQVSRLIRTAYGPFHLLDLPRGLAVEIRQVDVERFRKGLKGLGPAPERVAITAPATAPAAPPARTDAPGRKQAEERPAKARRGPQMGPRAAAPARDADKRPARPGQDADRRPARPARDGDKRPARPTRDTDKRPGRPGHDADRRPARPARDGDKRPARPARGPARPDGAGPPRGGGGGSGRRAPRRGRS